MNKREYTMMKSMNIKRQRGQGLLTASFLRRLRIQTDEEMDFMMLDFQESLVRYLEPLQIFNGEFICK